MSDPLHYDTLDEYNADVYAARNANYDDETARQGLCVVCETRKRDGAHRRCWECRHSGAQA